MTPATSPVRGASASVRMQAIGIVLVASAPWFTDAPSDNFSWWMIGAVLLGCGNSTCLSNAAGGEHVTVISGTFNLGMGEKVDKSGGRALSAGAFAFMPPGMRHFAWTTGETVIQLHGTGPWKIN